MFSILVLLYLMKFYVINSSLYYKLKILSDIETGITLLENLGCQNDGKMWVTDQECKIKLFN